MTSMLPTHIIISSPNTTSITNITTATTATTTTATTATTTTTSTITTTTTSTINTHITTNNKNTNTLVSIPILKQGYIYYITLHILYNITYII